MSTGLSNPASTTRTTRPASRSQSEPARKNGHPVLPAVAEPASHESAPELLREIRAFHVGGGAGAGSPLDDDVLPALVHPYRDVDRLRFDYPLYACPRDGALDCRPIAEQLEAWIAEIRAERGARILEDNRERLERQIGAELGDRVGPVAARPLIAGAGAALRDALGLDGEPAAALKADLQALDERVPDAAVLVGFGDDTDAALILLATRATMARRRAAFADEVRRLSDRLESLIRIERSKDPDARDAKALQKALGAGSAHFDVGNLARVLGDHRGAERVAPGRRARIESALDTLRHYIDTAEDAPFAILVSEHGHADIDGVRTVRADDPCAAAAEAFDRIAIEMAEVLRAVRIARLELDRAYDPALHDPWLAALTWEGFTPDELRLVPRVLAWETAARLSGAGLRPLSTMLRSGRPVNVFVRVAPAGDPDPGAEPGAARMELGYVAISHREALVHQSAAARPLHLIDGVCRGLVATRAAVHVLASARDAAGQAARPSDWLHTSAAIDARAHPLFCYDPEPGPTWARRFDLGGNTDPDADWPVAELLYADADGQPRTMELAFTFADLAVLEPGLRRHFRLVPDGVPAEHLEPVDEWLRSSLAESEGRVPYVWIVDGEGALRRAAVTRELALAARDRQRYWRTLQEWAGVRNEHVERAVAAAVEEARADHAAAIDRLQADHAAELERVRREEAGASMQRLAAMLLETDLSTLPSSSAGAAPAAPPARAEAPAPAIEEAEEAAAAGETAADEDPDEDLSFDEPFIDTPLCTSCNDCTDLNSLLFVYDENKQARIGDPDAGTFEQLVLAAEACPANCIHPGRPRDPDEPNLAELLERAAPYQ